MPFTRISLLAGKSPDYLAAITDSLDRAMVEAFEVPETDRFVALHQHQPGELVFDRTYRGGPRSDDFVLFHVTTGKNRSHETKQRFYARLVERLASDATTLRASMFRQGRSLRPLGLRNGIRATVYPLSQLARRLRGG